MGATIRDVAALSGLSLGTVSKYINGKEVKEINRVKIEQAINELNFRPNSIAKGLRNAQTFTVAVLVPTLTSVFCTVIISAIEKYLLTKGYSVIICECQEDEEAEIQKADFLIQKMVDGIILLPFSPNGRQVEFISKYNIPLVMIDRIMDNHPTDGVIIDNNDAGFSPTEKLIKMGHRKIGIITGNINLFTSKGRLDGYQRALKTYGIACNQDYIKDGNYTVQGGHNATLELWSLPDPPTALLITNYDMTIGTFVAVNQLHLNIPNDISIIGFDNLPLAEVITPKLSLTVQPLEEMGRSAADLIYRRIHGDFTNYPEVIVHKSETFIEDSIKDITKIPH